MKKKPGLTYFFKKVAQSGHTGRATMMISSPTRFLINCRSVCMEMMHDDASRVKSPHLSVSSTSHPDSGQMRTASVGSGDEDDEFFDCRENLVRFVAVKFRFLFFERSS